jgi:hypothetical protein
VLFKFFFNYCNLFFSTIRKKETTFHTLTGEGAIIAYFIVTNNHRTVSSVSRL